MVVSWHPDVPIKLVGPTYQRTPEDVVLRRKPDNGPDLRYLRAGSRAHLIRGELPLTGAQADVFEQWRIHDLDRGLKAFTYTLFDHPAPRDLIVRFAKMPEYKPRAGGRYRVAIELRSDPPEPTPEALLALASLDPNVPAQWPALVPGIPRRADYVRKADSQVRRPDDRGPAEGELLSRREGQTETVSLPMMVHELEAFEFWFETEAAFGARDIAFPMVEGGTHLGCFSTGYEVRMIPNQAVFLVSFERYLEAYDGSVS